MTRFFFAVLLVFVLIPFAGCGVMGGLNIEDFGIDDSTAADDENCQPDFSIPEKITTAWGGDIDLPITVSMNDDCQVMVDFVLVVVFGNEEDDWISETTRPGYLMADFVETGIATPFSNPNGTYLEFLFGNGEGGYGNSGNWEGAIVSDRNSIDFLWIDTKEAPLEGDIIQMSVEAISWSYPYGGWERKTPGIETITTINILPAQ